VPTTDEIEAAGVVERLEQVASGNRPRLANGMVLVAIAVVALATACEPSRPAERTAPATPSVRAERAVVVIQAH
jgi:hypothetical protein